MSALCTTSSLLSTFGSNFLVLLMLHSTFLALPPLLKTAPRAKCVNHNVVPTRFLWPFASTDLTRLRSTMSIGTIYASIDMQPLWWRETKQGNSVW